MVRRLAIGIAASAAVLGPTTAWAEGKTVVTYTGSPDFRSEIRVRAAPGEVNSLKFHCDSTTTIARVCFSDPAAGITESSPHCNQPEPTEVRCTASELRRVRITARDRADTLRIISDDLVILKLYAEGGAGGDRGFLLGPSGDAKGFRFLGGGDGNDILRARGRASIGGDDNRDTLRGGSGPQQIYGGNGSDRISCGKGKDFAYGGPGRNSGGAGCEEYLDR